jgi:hypothetical protein
MIPSLPLTTRSRPSTVVSASKDAMDSAAADRKEVRTTCVHARLCESDHSESFPPQLDARAGPKRERPKEIRAGIRRPNCPQTSSETFCRFRASGKPAARSSLMGCGAAGRPLRRRAASARTLGISPDPKGVRPIHLAGCCRYARRAGARNASMHAGRCRLGGKPS